MRKNRHEGSRTRQDDMLPEYDFRSKQGERGKYHRAYATGHAVRIHRENGTVTMQYSVPQEGVVVLEPDLRKYFPDSESVNKTLRSLVALIPTKKSVHSAASGKARQSSIRP